MPDDSHASLQLVSSEIAAELNEARAALEAFAEQPEDRGALHRFTAHLHLVHGALRLAEVYGAALLAEEMEQVARYVDTHSGSGRADADGLDALLRAMVQLPSYLDRVLPAAATWRSCCCRCSTTCAPCMAARCCPKARCCC